MFEVTWQCNLRCIHCFQYKPDKEELTREQIKNILDQLAEAGCFYLTFTGGEPLVRKDFFEIAEYAKEKNFVLTLYTNGTLITPKVAERIFQINFLYVQISIHGATSKTHDKITGIDGSFQEAMAGIKILKEKGINVGLATTIMRPNFNELEAIEKLHNLSTDESRFSPMIYPANDGNEDPLKLNLYDNQLRTFFSFIYKKNIGTTEKRSIITGLYCEYGRTGCCVSARGDLYPCVAVPISVGNLKKEAFKNIWSSAPLLRWIREKTVDDLKECKNCNLAPYCCRCCALAYWEKGDLLASATNCCRQAKISKEVMINEREKTEDKISEAKDDRKEDYCTLF